MLTVGAVLRGDDAAGPYLGKQFDDAPQEGWTVFNGDQMPEDYLAPIRRMEPDLLVVVDAADMKLEPGAVRVLEEDDVATDYLMTTHSLPISIMLGELRSCCREIVFLGIQPAQTDFFSPMTEAVLEAVERVEASIRACHGSAAVLREGYL